MPRYLLVFIGLLLTTLIQAQNFSAGSIADVPSYDQLEQLSWRLERKRHENSSKTLELQALKDENNVNVSPDTIIKEKDLSQTYIELEQARLQIDNLKTQLTTVEQELQAVQKRNNTLNSLLQFQSNPLSDLSMGNNQSVDIDDTKDKLARSIKHERLLKEQKQLIIDSIALGNQQLSLLGIRYQRLNEHYLELQNISPDSTLSAKVEDRNTKLEQLRERLSTKLAQPSNNRSTRLDLNIELAIVTKQLFLNDLWRDYLAIERRLQDLQFVDFSSISLERIDNVQQEITFYQDRLASMSEQLQKNYNVINEQYTLYELQRESVPYNIASREKKMSQRYEVIIKSLDNSQLGIKIISDQINQQYAATAKTYLTKHYNFTHNIKNLNTLGKDLLSAGSLFVGQYVVTIKTFYQQIQSFSFNYWLLFISICITLVVVTAVITMYMNRVVRRKRQVKKLPFTARLILFLFSMFKYNVPYIGLFLLVWIALALTKVISPSYELLLLPTITLLMICIPYFSGKILLSTELLKTANDKSVIRPIILISTVGSLLFALVIMAKTILEDENIIDTFRWLFGLYVLAISWPFWQMVRQALGYLDDYYKDYLSYRILRVIILILPIATTVFGLASLIGYLNIAWIVAKYVIYFEVFAIIWVALIALLKDASLWAKRYALQNTENGLFWAQDIISPLHTLLRYGSLLLLCNMLLTLYEWDSNTPFVYNAIELLNTPLFLSGEESQFTLRNIILMGLLLYVVNRVGRWIRSLSYRWIYGSVLDLGVRNSLAVFSQYAVVTIGVLLALRMIGLDLTTFTIFAGALGVGIGFGMQTIANNFISGILLLIERPLRNGDIISVGNNLGTVERIGMRSLTMTTFDNESLILPNSDFVTSSFINWTHSDQIIRLCLYLDIDYTHNPLDVTALLNRVITTLVSQNKIISEGELESGVYAHQYSERGITYRIVYYFDMEKHGYIPTRDLIISAIWQACYDHNLQLSYPKRDVFLPANPSQLAEVINEHPLNDPSKLLKHSS